MLGDEEFPYTISCGKLMFMTLATCEKPCRKQQSYGRLGSSNNGEVGDRREDVAARRAQPKRSRSLVTVAAQITGNKIPLFSSVLYV